MNCIDCAQRKIHARLRCQGCYARYRTSADFERVQAVRRQRCLVCDRLAAGRGYCNRHYMQVYRTGAVSEDDDVTPHQLGVQRRWHNERASATGTEDTYSLAQIATLFGVWRGTVSHWVERGWLQAARMSHGYAVTHANLRRFIAAYGLLRCLKPDDPNIQAQVTVARQRLQARYISTAELCTLLARTDDPLHYQQREGGFPAPALRLGARGGGDYYDRAAVRAWLNEHSHYWTSAAKERL